MATSAQIKNSKANTEKRSLTSLRFPHDLDFEGNGSVIRFNINIPEGSKYLAGGEYTSYIDPVTNQKSTSNFRKPTSESIAKRFSSNYVRTTTVIDMFMPHDLNTSYQSNWNVEELGIIGSGIDAGVGVSEYGANLDDVGEAWNVIKKSVPEMLANTLAGTADALSPFNAKGAKKFIDQTVANPYIEVLFGGVENRTFSFTFKMTPRNADEQKTIKDIIKEFKFHRAPETKIQGLSNYWIFPSEFDIKLMYKGLDNPWLFKISTCALTNVTVSYSGDGDFKTRADGSPFTTVMTLQFTELEQLTKEHHAEGY